MTLTIMRTGTKVMLLQMIDKSAKFYRPDFLWGFPHSLRSMKNFTDKYHEKRVNYGMDYEIVTTHPYENTEVKIIVDESEVDEMIDYIKSVGNTILSVKVRN